MLRAKHAVWAALLLLVLAPLTHAADAVDAIPGDATLVIRLKAPKATLERVATFVDFIQPGFGNAVRNQTTALGNMILNPTLDGVDLTSDWYVAMILPTKPGDDPTTLFVIPAKDAGEMEKALTGVKFAKHDKWGVYTEDEAFLKKSTECLKSGASIKGVVDKPSFEVLDRGDVSIYVNVAAAIKSLGPQLDEVSKKLDEELEKAKDREVPGIDFATISPFIKQAVEGLLTGVRDTKGISIAINASKAGLNIEELVRVNPGSATDKYFATCKPGRLGGMTTLPQGAQMYYGLDFDSKSILAWVSKVLTGVKGVDNYQELVKVVKESMEELSKVSVGASVGAMETGDFKNGLFRTLQISEVDDGFKVRDVGRKMYKSIIDAVKTAGAATPNVKQEMKITEKAETIAGHEIDLITVLTTLEGDDFGASIGKKVLEVMYGEAGSVTRMAYGQKQIVQTSGGGKTFMEKCLTALSEKKPIASVEKARGMLNTDAQFQFLFDLPGFLLNGAKLAAENPIQPIPGLNGAMLEGLELKESFIGFSIGAGPDGIRCTTNVPVEQCQGVARIGTMFFLMFAQARQ